MESQPQNPEFRNNPESFHPCMYIAETDASYVEIYASLCQDS